MEAKKVMHEPVEGDCMICHSHHGGEDKSFLLSDLTELCGMVKY